MRIINQNILSLLICLLTCINLSACGIGASNATSSLTPLPTVGVTQQDGTVVHGRAIVTVANEQTTAINRLINQLLMPSAYATSSASVGVTYTNAASTTFAINTSALVAAGFTGNTLGLGNVSISTLSDNNLEVCGTNSNQKCNTAMIRMYTSGSVAGFVNTAYGYGAPVYAGTLNPTSALGLNSAGSVQVQLATIGATSYRTSLANFPSPTYAVSSDFSNAGAGSYSMNLVIEYALSQ